MVLLINIVTHKTGNGTTKGIMDVVYVAQHTEHV